MPPKEKEFSARALKSKLTAAVEEDKCQDLKDLLRLMSVSSASTMSLNREKHTVLHLACRWERWDQVEILLDFGVSTKVKDNKKNIAVYYAIKRALKKPYKEAKSIYNQVINRMYTASRGAVCDDNCKGETAFQHMNTLMFQLGFNESDEDDDYLPEEEEEEDDEEMVESEDAEEEQEEEEEEKDDIISVSDDDEEPEDIEGEESDELFTSESEEMLEDNDSSDESVIFDGFRRSFPFGFSFVFGNAFKFRGCHDENCSCPWGNNFFDADWDENQEDEDDDDDSSFIGDNLFTSVVHGPQLLKLKEEYDQKCHTLFDEQHQSPVKLSDLPFSSAESTQAIADAIIYNVSDPKKYVRRQQLRWHPDKFMQNFGARLDASDKKCILKRATTISQAVNTLWSKLNR